MKRLRHFCGVTILTFTLGFSVIAGEMECGVVDPPPSPPPSSVMGNMATGVTTTSEASSAETGYIDPVTGLALDMLQSLLSLF